MDGKLGFVGTDSLGNST